MKSWRRMPRMWRCGMRESEISWGGCSRSARRPTATDVDRMDEQAGALHTRRFACLDSRHCARVRRLKLHHEKETNHDKHRSVAQEFARNGRLRTGWSGGTPCGKRACPRGLEYGNRRNHSEVV